MSNRNNIKSYVIISPFKNMQSLKKIDIKALSVKHSSDHMIFDYGNTYMEFLSTLFTSLIVMQVP